MAKPIFRIVCAIHREKINIAAIYARFFVAPRCEPPGRHSWLWAAQTAISLCTVCTEYNARLQHTSLYTVRMLRNTNNITICGHGSIYTEYVWCFGGWGLRNAGTRSNKHIYIASKRNAVTTVFRTPANCGGCLRGGLVHTARYARTTNTFRNVMWRREDLELLRWLYITRTYINISTKGSYTNGTASLFSAPNTPKNRLTKTEYDTRMPYIFYPASQCRRACLCYTFIERKWLNGRTTAHICGATVSLGAE